MLPSVHRVTHGHEVAAARASHAAVHHATPGSDDAGIEVPCAPQLNDMDCAICAGVSAAVDLAVAVMPLSSGETQAFAARADRVRRDAAFGSGARAPPVS